jgi:hypothetical protein
MQDSALLPCAQADTQPSADVRRPARRAGKPAAVLILQVFAILKIERALLSRLPVGNAKLLITDYGRTTIISSIWIYFSVHQSGQEVHVF